jgi:hypothetical protein
MTPLDFTTLVQNQIAAIQAATIKILDFSIGSVLRALVESNSSVVIYLQTLLLRILASTRAATCSGEDLDTWMADYGLARLQAIGSTGYVTFSRFTTALAANLPIGYLVETSTGAQVFTVLADETHANYNPLTKMYVIPAGQASITVPIEAIYTGSTTNVMAGAINTLTQSIPGIDVVTNALALTNGVDAETDTAFRTRFIEYIASLARATQDAIAYAILKIQPGLTYTIVENYDYAGAVKQGYFYVVVDDGTGQPVQTLLDSISASINAVRPLCSTYGVYAPVIVAANVSMNLTLSGGDAAVIKQMVKDNITTYLNKVGLGNTAPYTILAQLAYNTSPFITNVTGILLNGATADLTVTKKQVIKAGTVGVN